MSNPTKPLVTLIIPTRERAETLQYTLKTGLDQETESIEIIVSDNFSGDHTKEVVASFSDRRVRYINTGRRLSMSDNWEFALQHACGDYVIFVGDDDAVMPGALDKLETVIRAKRSLVYSWPLPVYSWPIDGQGAHAVSVPPPGRRREVDLEKLARFVVSTGGIRYSSIPCMYHSAVARGIPDKIRERTGRVFHSTLPDVFMSLAVPVFAARAVHVGFYVSVHGLSRKSNGAIRISESARSNVERFIREYGDYKIHPKVFPKMPVPMNFVVDAMLVAMGKFPEFYDDKEFNFDAMWAFMWSLKSTFRHQISPWEVLSQRREIRRYHPFSTARFLSYCALYVALGVRRKLVQKVLRFDPLARRRIENISDFVQELSQRESVGVEDRARR